VSSPTQYTRNTAIALVVANMIGTGVFTSLGYQVGSLPSGFVLMMLWLLGGVVALSGAMTYAEIATALKRSGGEYVFLTELYHPLLGFLSGWMSFLVGFAGAIAAVAIAIGAYATEVTGLPERLIAILAILLMAGIHGFGVILGGRVQTFLTSFKLLLIVFFCLTPLAMEHAPSSGIRFLPQPGDLDLLLSPGFAVSLVFVVYAYTGWNASAYIAGNLENPSRTLPLSLISGTVLVTLAYLALNATFLEVATTEELEGQNDIGNVVAHKLFGATAGNIFAGIFSFALLSTLSAMTIAGPRVLEAMGKDYARLRFLVRTNSFQMPWVGMLIQTGWAVFLVLVSSFKEIIQYISVSLSLSAMLTVAGVFLLRKRTGYVPGFRLPFYPWPSIFFILVTLWMIVYVTADDYRIILYTLASLVPGMVLYALARQGRGND
jgi:basic amino acid/polyamine antiporter, APA family